MSDALPLQRLKNMPGINVLRVQGENRYIARVHENTEYKTATGLVIPNGESTQNIPTTGDVLVITKHFDGDKFPDVRPGMCVKVTMNGWSPFKVDGVLYAVGDARSVIAAYDPNEICQE